MSARTLIIEATEQTPKISFDSEHGNFSIVGKSLPESGESFYQPILAWLDKGLDKSATILNFEFSLPQLNLSSSKMLLFILYKLKEQKEAGKQVSIWWYHGDENSDILEVGEDYEFMVDIPFRFKTGHLNLANKELIVL